MTKSQCHHTDGFVKNETMKNIKDDGFMYSYVHIDKTCRTCGEQVQQESIEKVNAENREKAKGYYIKHRKDRKLSFLSGRTPIERFTKKTIIKHYHVSEELFDRMLQEGYIEQMVLVLCDNCLRDVTEQDLDDGEVECTYCSEGELVENRIYYRYTQKLPTFWVESQENIE